MGWRDLSDNMKAAWIAGVSGVLMLISGVTGASQWGRTFILIESYFGTSTLVRFAQLVFVALGSVGGIFVLLAAYAFRADRVRTGKILIWFGTGFTLISLLLFLVITAQRGEWPFAGGAVIGFAGIFLSVLARLRAVPKPLKL